MRRQHSSSKGIRAKSNCVKDGLKKIHSDDQSGAKSIKRLIKMSIVGGPKDLSQNLDKYLYD